MMHVLENTANTYLGFYQDFRLNYRWNKYTAKKLDSLAKHGKSITAQVKQQCDDYAQTVLGSRKFSPSLQVCSAIRGQFLEGWIPQNYYFCVVVPRANAPFDSVAPLKTFANVIFKSESIPDIGYLIRGLFFDRNMNVIDKDRVARCFFEADEKIVYKRDNTSQGRGVLVVSKDKFDVDKIASSGNAVFQKYFKQHDIFNQINSSSTGAVRVTTVRYPDGRVKAVCSYVKLATTDRGTSRAESDVIVVVDVASQTLLEHGMSADGAFRTSHPGSGFVYGGQKIPALLRAFEVCETLHAKIPHVTCIGWDVGIDVDEKVNVLEWNAWRNGIEVTEAFTGPCFQGLEWEELWKTPLPSKVLGPDLRA